MYRTIAMLGIVLFLLMTTACAYESLPEPPATSVALQPTVPPLVPLMSAKEPLATAGPCSIAEANRKLQTGLMPVTKTNYALFSGASFGLDFSWRAELEGGLVLSLPDETYVFLRLAAPIADKTSTLVLPVTKESFESLIQGVPSIKAGLAAITGLPISAYYLTGHSCLPPSKQIR